MLNCVLFVVINSSNVGKMESGVRANIRVKTYQPKPTKFENFEEFISEIYNECVISGVYFAKVSFDLLVFSQTRMKYIYFIEGSTTGKIQI